MKRRNIIKALVAIAASLFSSACSKPEIVYFGGDPPDMELVFDIKHEVSIASDGVLTVDGHEYTQDTVGELLLELKRHNVDVELRKKR